MKTQPKVRFMCRINTNGRAAAAANGLSTGRPALLEDSPGRPRKGVDLTGDRPSPMFPADLATLAEPSGRPRSLCETPLHI